MFPIKICEGNITTYFAMFLDNPKVLSNQLHTLYKMIVRGCKASDKIVVILRREKKKKKTQKVFSVPHLLAVVVQNEIIMNHKIQ